MNTGDELQHDQGMRGQKHRYTYRPTWEPLLVKQFRETTFEPCNNLPHWNAQALQLRHQLAHPRPRRNDELPRDVPGSGCRGDLNAAAVACAQRPPARHTIAGEQRGTLFRCQVAVGLHTDFRAETMRRRVCDGGELVPSRVWLARERTHHSLTHPIPLTPSTHTPE